MKMRFWPDGRLVVHAPAKVNLFLEVLGKRSDGYHELETFMVAVNVYDTLVFEEDRGGEVEFHTDDATIPAGPENLVVRSAHLIREEAGTKAGVKIWLRKRIPASAGLGGGSSDAAATLLAINQLWKLGLTLPALSRLGARIGSDVPFFFYTPAAIGRGRGEILTPVPLPQPLHLVLVCPQQGCNTAAVYRALPPVRDDDRRSLEPVLQQLAIANMMSLGSLLFNRLQATACSLCPAIAQAHAAMRDTGLAGPFVTGSGSASFGLARDRTAAVQAAHSIMKRFQGRVLIARSTPVEPAAREAFPGGQ